MVACKGCLPLIHENVMDKSIATGAVEELVALLARLLGYILAKVTSCSSLLGDHGLINGIHGSLRHLQNLPGNLGKEGLHLERPVHSSGCMVIIIEVQV